MEVRRSVLDFLILSVLVFTTQATLVNISIDDTFGDLTTGQQPKYSAGWLRSTQCDSGCGFQPQLTSSAFNKTWTAGTYNPPKPFAPRLSITFNFTGNSIWVFFILLNNMSVSTAADQYVPFSPLTNCNFTLDGSYAGNFSHMPNGSNTVVFNATVFSKSGLSNSQHNLVISANNLSFLIFDYALYTVGDEALPTSTPSSTSSFSSDLAYSSSSRTASASSNNASPSMASGKSRAIVGSALGIVALVMSIVVILHFRRLRRRKRKGYTKPIAVAFNLKQPQRIIDDVGMGDARVPWESATLLTPVRRDYQSPYGPGKKTQDELRVERRTEINRRLQEAQQEMQNLIERQMALGDGDGPSPSVDVRRQGAYIASGIKSD